MQHVPIMFGLLILAALLTRTVSPRITATADGLNNSASFDLTMG